jgi:hypothetical protein
MQRCRIPDPFSQRKLPSIIIALTVYKQSPEETSDDSPFCGVCEWCQSLEPHFTRPDSRETSAETESSSTRKRKRDLECLNEDDTLASLHRMKQSIAEQRHLALSDIDDLTLSLNLHQLEPRPSTILGNSRLAQTIEARQGFPSPYGTQLFTRW